MSTEKGRQILSELDEVVLTSGKALHVPRYLDNGDIDPLCGRGKYHDDQWVTKPASVFRTRPDRVCDACIKDWNAIGGPDPKTIKHPLTTRETEMFIEAYRCGHFEWPREAPAAEVAEALDVNASTVSQLLRNAVRKVIGKTDLDTDVKSLTDRQREVLQTASEKGYFEFPRETDLQEIADKLDIAQSTANQHLRIGVRKTIEQSSLVEELSK